MAENGLFARRTEPIQAPNGYQVFQHDLYCAECGNLAYPAHDSWVKDIDRRYVFCLDCAEKYRVDVPVLFPWGAVVKDNLNTVIVDYGYGTDHNSCYDKDCYFTHKGRYIKVKGKRYWLNRDNGLTTAKRDGGEAYS